MQEEHEQEVNLSGELSPEELKLLDRTEALLERAHQLRVAHIKLVKSTKAKRQRKAKLQKLSRRRNRK